MGQKGNEVLRKVLLIAQQILFIIEMGGIALFGKTSSRFKAGKHRSKVAIFISL